MTLIVKKAYYVDGQLRLAPNQELPPGLLPQETIDQWLDNGWLKECDPAQRPSLYRIFYRFSGCSQSEKLSLDEQQEYSLND